MRTTLDLDDDVLQAVKELGQMHKKTAGQMLSELARKALRPTRKYKVRNGVPIIHRRPGSPVITTADVRRWMDEDL
ncbi:MAG: antitoxin [Acidobacteria bacterium]|nr:antitoxin [Acidobacteriota bacterium]